ncbi:Periphilin-1 [Tupaia chinensis]|uniref:Periphilin-1 n=1 Tax=Tupaia chinensis TaxID=246437 RepID=L8Y7F5_TUPCH|nr:Periphilin-1 [Tupaia chinensis]
MFQIPVILGYRPRLAGRRNDMRSERRYQFERGRRGRVPPRSYTSDGHRGVFNVWNKSLGEESYNRRYSHVDYPEYAESRNFSQDRRGRPPYRGGELTYRRRGNYCPRRQLEYRNTRGGFGRGSFHSARNVRDQSPQRRDTPFIRGRKDPPYRRSSSGVGRTTVSPERSQSYSYQTQRIKYEHAGAFDKRRIEENPVRGSVRIVQVLKAPRIKLSASSSAIPSKVFSKPSGPTEKEVAEAAPKSPDARLEKSDKTSLPEIPACKPRFQVPLFVFKRQDSGSKPTEGVKGNPPISRSEAIALKVKEIEQGYRQDCEVFGVVVKKLIEKEPGLEKPVQFSLRQNLQEIGERYIEELKHFMEEYDASHVNQPI